MVDVVLDAFTNAEHDYSTLSEWLLSYVERLANVLFAHGSVYSIICLEIQKYLCFLVIVSSHDDYITLG